MQPDSLKLTSQLVILKHLHAVAFRIEKTQGDKSGGRTYFMRGIQGEVCRPVWNRDYLYLLGLVQQIREYLQENCVPTVLSELYLLAVDIFSRYDNRRRMGVELLLLCLLSSPSQTSWTIPEKYQAKNFIIDMLVSCRYRFQKPNTATFWSKQSEALLISTFKHSTKLTRLVLSLCNDAILRAIAVHCRNLVELEIGVAEDVTEDGLLALAGRSAQQNDQGQQRHWDHAVYLQKDFGPSRDWYIKDAMMFTATCTVKRALPPSQCDGLIQTYPTFFGCTKIRKFRLFGEFIYPPLVIRSKFKKFMTGPQLESGLYALLLHWSHLRRFSVGVATPVLLSRLAALLGAGRRVLQLRQLALGKDEQLDLAELPEIASLCSNLKELTGLSIAVLNDRYLVDRPRMDEALCDFLKRFTKLRQLSGSIKLPCLNSFLAHAGEHLTILNLSAQVSSSYDLLVLRRYCVSLERLELNLCLDSTVDRAYPDSHAEHTQEFEGTFSCDSISASASSPAHLLNMDSPWHKWKPEVERWAWKRLRYLELSGRFNLRVAQILAAAATDLETLCLTNLPNEMVAGGMAFDDSWIQGILDANPLASLKELTLRMGSDHFVEEGFLTKTSLLILLNHALAHSPRLEKIVGEWTRIPDREISGYEEEYGIKGLRVNIRNAEPYREFQNMDDNDRFYGMNEGYWRHNGAVSLDPNQEEEEGDHENEEEGAAAEGGKELQRKFPRCWGYAYRPFKQDTEPRT